MPVILAEERHAKWLGTGDLKELLKPYPAEEMKCGRLARGVEQPER